MRLLRLIAICFLCVIASCRSHSGFRLGDAPVQVELDAFSGRPNPHWELTGPETAEFAKRLRDLKASQTHTAAFEGLGYRGFVIHSKDEEIRVYRGAVIVKRNSHEEILSDAKRMLERWLFDSARKHVDEAVLQYIGSELARE
jgi:hypothetical protein